jgi:hypothetical protein
MMRAQSSAASPGWVVALRIIAVTVVTVSVIFMQDLPEIFVSHIRQGVEIASADPSALLIFSGQRATREGMMMMMMMIMRMIMRMVMMMMTTMMMIMMTTMIRRR